MILKEEGKRLRELGRDQVEKGRSQKSVYFDSLCYILYYDSI